MRHLSGLRSGHEQPRVRSLTRRTYKASSADLCFLCGQKPRLWLIPTQKSTVPLVDRKAPQHNPVTLERKAHLRAKGWLVTRAVRVSYYLTICKVHWCLINCCVIAAGNQNPGPAKTHGASELTGGKTGGIKDLTGGESSSFSDLTGSKEGDKSVSDGDNKGGMFSGITGSGKETGISGLTDGKTGGVSDLTGSETGGFSDLVDKK